MEIGIISDTHGLLRPEAIEALRGSELILHAGDIGSQPVLDGLKRLAPVVAIRGNCDEGGWADRLPEFASVSLGDVTAYMLHDLKELSPASAMGARVIISGHTHQPSIETRANVLYLNPGSAGRRRFRLPVTLARLSVDGANVSAKLVHLLDPSS